jgi:exonuclease SbcD
MRILHTSDWHLGKTLSGYSRVAEHEAFVDEVVELAADVDLVLLSGDVFDTYNPPIDAEELFFDTLARLGDGGRRAVVVIAGNHDSPDRLAAPVPLSSTHGVWILGRPGDVAVQKRTPRPDRVRLAASAPSSLTLDLPCGQRAVVAALPYPSEARLRSLLTDSTDERDLHAAYTARIARAFEQLTAHFEPGAVHLATSHLAVKSCMPSESERALVGGAYQIEASALPAAAQYVGLGHLHMPQAVPDAPTPTWYAGAPLAFRFSEADHRHEHLIVEVDPGTEAALHHIPVAAGRPLVTWEATSLAEVRRGVDEGLHADAFLDLRIAVDARLTHTELASLRRLPRDLVRIRAVLPDAVGDAPAPEARRHLPTSELFRAFYREQTDHEPEDALVDLFVELAAEAHATP